MDAYSVSFTPPSQRHSSRIYQDLHVTRVQSVLDLEPDKLVQAADIMDCISKPRTRNGGKKPRVGVIGAGLAGLRCADVLLQHGFEVTVLEGRDRVGGRTCQQKLPNGHTIDLGPNWIHGTNDNPILDLAKKTGTTIRSWESSSYVFNEVGSLFSLEDGEKYSTLMWDIVQDAFKYSNEFCPEIDSGDSLHDFFTRKVVEKIPESTPDFERQRYIVMQMAELWGAFVGSPLTRQSLKFFWLEECIDGENLFCAGTYAKILEEIARPVITSNVVKYETVVSAIQTKDDADGTVKVSTANGETVEFDEIVLTAPLGWLKQNLAAFEPPLPARLTKAIGSLGYGCLEKVYISFPKAFWRNPDAQGRVVQGFCQWLSPIYATESNPSRWTQEVVELGSLEGEDGHPTLLFYIYGAESEHITSTLASLADAQSEKRDAFIFSFFEPYYSRLPHYDAQSPDCRPTAQVATSWLRDDLAGNGSYTNFQVGLEDGDGDVRVLREGVPNRGLWLAGEHTAPFVALGTATGAYWSGESAARRISEAYGLDKGGRHVGPHERS